MKTKGTLPEGILGQVEALSSEQKLEPGDALKAMIARELARGEDLGDEVPPCPHCHGTHVIRKGKARDGSPRFLCRGCGRTFGAGTLSVLGQSRLPSERWIAFAEGMADGLALRELVERCDVCLKTAWLVRMGVCEAMARSGAARAPAAGRAAPCRAKA